MAKDSKRLQNFICNATQKWNEVFNIIFEHCTPITIRGGLLQLIPGSAVGSDLTAKSSTIKLKLKNILLSIQSKGYTTIWDPRNFDLSTYRGPNWTWGL